MLTLVCQLVLIRSQTWRALAIQHCQIANIWTLVCQLAMLSRTWREMAFLSLPNGANINTSMPTGYFLPNMNGNGLPTMQIGPYTTNNLHINFNMSGNAGIGPQNFPNGQQINTGYASWQCNLQHGMERSFSISKCSTDTNVRMACQQNGNVSSLSVSGVNMANPNKI